jgi:L-fucose isomerase-like protein
VQEKLLRFVKAGLAVARMRGKSTTSNGRRFDGIAGSIRRTRLFEHTGNAPKLWIDGIRPPL